MVPKDDPREQNNPDIIVRDDVRVEWTELGEGWFGEYNEDDPEDEELLRFDVYKWDDEAGEWEPLDDASYCTRMPVEVDPAIRRKALERLMDEFHDPVMSGYSIKKLGERMSWIAPHWIKEDGDAHV